MIPTEHRQRIIELLRAGKQRYRIKKEDFPQYSVTLIRQIAKKNNIPCFYLIGGMIGKNAGKPAPEIYTPPASWDIEEDLRTAEQTPQVPCKVSMFPTAAIWQKLLK